jgi:hypothetical protein
VATWTLDHPDKLTFDTVRALRVATTSGKLNVVGTDGPPTVEVTRVSGRPLIVEQDGDTLTIRQERPGGGLLSLVLTKMVHNDEVDVSVSVPPDCVVDLDVVSGPIVVSNLHEHTKVVTTSGDVTLAELHGDTAVNAVSGNITAESVTGDFSAHTVSGGITVIAGGGGSIAVGTTSGEITLDVEAPEPKSIELDCISGAITVRLPHQPNLAVEMTAMHGTVTSAFPDLRTAKSFVSTRLAGVLGDGSGRLRASATSGRLTLLRRDADADAAFDDDDDGGWAGGGARTSNDENGEESR